MKWTKIILFQLKAFYVDLIVPLETNLEKDIKIVQVKFELKNSKQTLLADIPYFARGQAEQKKFQHQQKSRTDTYSKAANTMKKHRKKNRSKGTAISKELRVGQKFNSTL